jgi:hypothetical protein
MTNSLNWKNIVVAASFSPSLGVGKVQYSSIKALEVMGKKNQRPLIHCDYMFLE